MGYVALAGCSVASLVWRHPLADLAAVEIGPVGAAATALCLVTGSLWGRPTWGAWWVWDARLTSVLVLFFLYLGHIALVRAFDDPERGYRSGAILALVGVVNLPIIKFSVDWWNTLHQRASISLLGSSHMPPSMGIRCSSPPSALPWASWPWCWRARARRSWSGASAPCCMAKAHAA